MTSVDITTIIQAIEGVLATVITGLIITYVPKALAAFQAHTGVVLTENQRQTFLGAAKTAAGILETRLDQGLMSIEHINITNNAVVAQAQAVINAVPQAAAALGMTQAATARILIGMVDTAAHPGSTAAGSQTAQTQAAAALSPSSMSADGPAPLKTWVADPVPAIPPVPKTT
jgi:hypothetical protein